MTSNRHPFEDAVIIRQLIGQMPLGQTMTLLVQRSYQVTAAFDVRFDDI
jgi:hypothetical protein